MPDPARKHAPSRLFGWWYLSIGLGFFLLGLRYLLLGQPLGSVVLRWGIAAGFLILGWMTLRGG